MIIRSANFTERPDNGGGDIDCWVHLHAEDGTVTTSTVTIGFDSCYGRHASRTHLSVESAKKLRDALNEVLGDKQ